MNLFFDVETTGFNRRKDNLVQLAWILTDANGKIIQEADHIIEPDGFTIPHRATALHGITTDEAQAIGIKLDEALDEFSSAAKAAKNIIAHNISFDHDVLETEFGRCGMNFPLLGKTQICTMRLSVNWCRLPKLNGMKGFKRPRLDELYYKLFGESFENAHDALSDTRACMRCYYKLVELHVISVPEANTTHQTRPEQKVDADHNYKKGYLAGYKEGRKVGSQEGYNAAFDEGYNTGYGEALRESEPSQLLSHHDQHIRVAAAASEGITPYNMAQLFFFEVDETDFEEIIWRFDDCKNAEDFEDLMFPVNDEAFKVKFNALLDITPNQIPNEVSLFDKIAYAFDGFFQIDLVTKLFAFNAIPNCIISKFLFLFRTSASAEIDTVAYEFSRIIRESPHFDLVEYQNYLRLLFEKRLIADEDEPDFTGIVDDPDCPVSLFEKINQFDFDVQLLMLQNKACPENIVKRFILEFYKKLENRDITSAETVNYYKGFYQHISNFEEDIVEINSILNNEDRFSDHVIRLAKSERDFYEVEDDETIGN